MKQITKDEFWKEFDDSVHSKLDAHWNDPETHGMIIFRNLAFDSSQFGMVTACPYGPRWTLKRWEEAQGKWIKDLPSQRQYADAYCVKEIPHD